MGTSRLSVSSSLFLVATADPRGLLRGLTTGLHGPGRAWLSHLGSLCTALGTAPFLWPEKEGTYLFFGDKSWPREEAAVPSARSPSSPPCPRGARCPLSSRLTGPPPPASSLSLGWSVGGSGASSPPRQLGTALSFYRSGQGKSLPSHPAKHFPWDRHAGWSRGPSRMWTKQISVDTISG